jgi:hypothetical protein
MRETRITLPELILVAGTRAALGAGLGLLLADRLSPGQRKAVGWTLFLVGGLSTVPLAFEVLGGDRLSEAASSPGQPAGEPRTRRSTDTGQPGGGRGRVDVTGAVPQGIRVDPNLTVGHPGYQESGSSEIIPTERLTRGGASG